MRTVGRVAALGAVVAAVVLVAMVLFGLGSGGYEVTAKFVNAGQIVKGNPVHIGGTSIGTVEGIDITDDGQAEIRLAIDDDRAPLREGTRAAIKQLSQSGIANRYVELSLPAGGTKEIKDGGLIGADKTRAAVDLDQLFNTIDPKTRRALQDFLKGNARQFRGTGTEAGDAFRYLNPALATSSRLFNELTRDKPVLERFLVDSSRLVTALGERRDDLSALIGNLNETTRALGSQKAALAQSIERLPPFMRRANTTFVNLRAALDEVDPLVDAAEPVAARLDPFLDEARGFAADAEPTVRDLRATVRRRGEDNDLIDFIDTVPRLTDIAVESKPRNGAQRAGAFPQSASAFRSAAPIISEARPYTTDFLGWLDDFSTTGGGFDALGAYARAFIGLGETLKGPAKRDQFKRCPGSAEEPASDGSNVLSADERRRLDCEESARATGDVP
ncbi:MAG: MlaD family protein [Actinomycetota bacterium]|nr:MlaD family protein [Actinomycetota bacterium]